MSTLNDNTNRIRGLLNDISILPKDRYETGLEEGYETGLEEGYDRGYAESVAEYEPLIDAFIENTHTRLVNDRVTKVQQNLCQNNNKLVEVNLPKCTRIGNYAFQSCVGLTTINLPELKTISAYSFQGCGGLKSVVFPKAESIDTAGLYGCWTLHTIDLPVCTYIKETSLVHCTVLTKLILRSPSVCTFDGGGGFANTAIAKGTGYIYVPDNLVEEYKTATNWSNYADQIKPISELDQEV